VQFGQGIKEWYIQGGILTSGTGKQPVDQQGYG